MSFIPKVAGAVISPLGAAAGLFGKDKPKPKRDPMADPYYKPQTDANGNPISTGGYRSGRGSSSLSV